MRSLRSTGRLSINPELMIRMLIISYCHDIRSERWLCEEVALNLAYRWFCRLDLNDAVADHSSFSKNRHGRFGKSDLLRRPNGDIGSSGFGGVKRNHCTTFRWPLFLLNPQDARESALLTRGSICQLGNAIVGAAEPPTELAVDILHHHHIRVDVGLVVRVEVLGGEFVQHGRALHDDGG
jgi:Transposase domain (DUF772)